MFEVFKFSKPDLLGQKHYINSYNFKLSASNEYTLDYFSRSGAVQNSPMAHCSGEQGEAKTRSGLAPHVELYKQNQLLGSFDITSRKICDANGQALIKLIDPTPPVRAVLRNALQGDPDTYLLVGTENRKLRYGKIERIKCANQLPWPLSIFERLFKVIFASQDQALYTIQVDSLPVCEALVLLACAVMDNNKLSQQAAI